MAGNRTQVDGSRQDRLKDRRTDRRQDRCRQGPLFHRKRHAYHGHDSHRNVRRRPRMLNRIKNPDVTKALANIVWLGLERLTQIAVAIAISGLLARYFGPDVFGKWQYANTLLLVLSPITWVCGAEILVPTIVNRTPSQLGTVLGSAFVLRMGVSAAALLVTWILTWIGIATGFTDPLVGAMLAGLAVTMLFREPFVGVINAWLQSMTYSKPQLLTSMLTAVAKAALVYVLVRAAASPARRPSIFSALWLTTDSGLSTTGMP